MAAFGQHGHGKMGLLVFDQDRVWVDINGKTHLIDEMPDVYIRNVITFLEANTDYFYVEARSRCILQMVGDALMGRM